MASQFAEYLKQSGACWTAHEWVAGRDLKTCLEDRSCPFFGPWLYWLVNRLAQCSVANHWMHAELRAVMEERDHLFHVATGEILREYPGDENLSRRLELYAQKHEECYGPLRTWALGHLAEIERAIARAVIVLR